MAVLPQVPTEEDIQKIYEENIRSEKLVSSLREQVKVQAHQAVVLRQTLDEKKRDLASAMSLVGVLYNQLKVSKRLAGLLTNQYGPGLPEASYDKDEINEH